MKVNISTKEEQPVMEVIKDVTFCMVTISHMNRRDASGLEFVSTM